MIPSSPERTEKLSQLAEALLFSEGGSLSLQKLTALMDCTNEECLAALTRLSAELHGRGISLVQTEREVTLAISSEESGFVRAALQRELGKEIGDAGLEVLAIILYRGASTRAQIDYIRGVNTSSTVRTMLARGLIERAGNPDDAREYLYRPTTELLAHLGIRNLKELPEYDTIRGELAAFEHGSEPFAAPHGDATDTAHDVARS